MKWVKDTFTDLINDVINGWIEDLMAFVLGLMADLVFNIPENDFVTKFTFVLASIISTAAVSVTLYKIIEFMIKESDGTQEYPFSEIIGRVIKAAGALLVLPWILRWFVFDFAVPLSNYFILLGTDFDGNAAATGVGLITAAIGAAFTGVGSIVLIVFLIFFLIAFFMFLFSVCVFYADIIMMQIYIAPVALSMIADENNFFQVWWRELISQIVSMLTKLFLVTLMLNILFSGGNMFLAIGAGVLIIKSPSILKNMWYAGGGGRGATRSAGALGSMSSRVLLTRLIR